MSADIINQIKMWDRIEIITTQRIQWVSPAADGVIPTPHGIWTVAGILVKDGNKELLVTKRGSACRVPIQDVRVLQSTERTYG